jgi:hypothetical protein
MRLPWLEDELGKTELSQIFNQTYDAYLGLLRNLGVTTPLDKPAMRKAISMVPATASNEPEEETEILESVDIEV